MDVSARCRASMQGVEIPADVDPASPKILEYFEAKLQELKQSGKNTPRAVIMCNPNNPLGRFESSILSIQEADRFVILSQGLSIQRKPSLNIVGSASDITYTCQ